MVKIYRTAAGCLAERAGRTWRLGAFSFDRLFREEDPAVWLESVLEGAPDGGRLDADGPAWLPPVESQEIWAAGVTYYRSREARMEESEATGGDVFYDKVYEAERPELFFKATARRARGHRAPVRVRQDSAWDVPEPEWTLAINARGRIFGCTVGNDVSSRDIEGQNPLYLPQAKVYRGSCAIGPCLAVGGMPPRETAIRLAIQRGGETVFEESTDLTRLKRTPEELAAFLFRENEFPDGALLMTGTGIVPPSGFTLQPGDEVSISIAGVGTLCNPVE